MACEALGFYNLGKSRGGEITSKTMKTNHNLSAYLSNLSNEIAVTKALKSLIYCDLY